MEGEIDSRIAEVRVVERVKSVEPVGILLGGTVASQQMAVEVDAHLGHHRGAVWTIGRRQLYTRQDILLAVGAQLAQWQLASG